MLAFQRRSCMRCGAGAHFFWGAVMYGYLLYDTAFTLVFWRAVGAPAFLAHHALGLACCAFGLYYNRCWLGGLPKAFGSCSCLQMVTPITTPWASPAAHSGCTATDAGDQHCIAAGAPD
jgi:hypothetical protein